MKIILLIATFSLSFTVYSQNVDQVLQNYFKATGSKEKWLRINSRKDIGKVDRVKNIQDQHDMVPQYQHEILLKYSFRHNDIVWDRFVSLDLNNPGDTSTSCFNGKEYWIQKNGEMPVFFNVYSNRYSLFSMIGYQDWLIDADSIAYGGYKEIDSFGCYILRVYKANIVLDLYFNTGTHYLTFYQAEGKDIITELNDYRNVDGLMIPFKETVFDQSEVISQYNLLNVVLNIKMDESLFSPNRKLGTLLK